MIRLWGAFATSGLDFAPSSLGAGIYVYGIIIAIFGILCIVFNAQMLRISKVNLRKPYGKAANIASKIGIAVGAIMFIYAFVMTP